MPESPPPKEKEGNDENAQPVADCSSVDFSFDHSKEARMSPIRSSRAASGGGGVYGIPVEMRMVVLAFSTVVVRMNRVDGSTISTIKGLIAGRRRGVFPWAQPTGILISECLLR